MKKRGRKKNQKPIARFQGACKCGCGLEVWGTSNKEFVDRHDLNFRKRNKK